MYGFSVNVCPIRPIAPKAVQTAKARECPTLPIRRGDHQQPMKKPTKWAEPNIPICPVVNPSVMPDIASKGPTPPVESCRRITERNRAAKEMIVRIVRPALPHQRALRVIIRPLRVVFCPLGVRPCGSTRPGCSKTRYRRPDRDNQRRRIRGGSTRPTVELTMRSGHQPRFRVRGTDWLAGSPGV